MMEYYKLGDVYKITKGKKVEALDDTQDDVIRYIQIDDLRNNNNIKYCAEDSKYVLVDEDDLIIAWDGANAGTVGYGLNGAIGSTLARLRTNSKDIFTPFVGRYMQAQSKALRDKCTGATIPHIQKSVLEEIQIPKYDIKTQEEISKVLDIAQELIDNRRKQLEACDELIKSRFIKMFGDPIKNDKMWETQALGELCTIVRGGSPRPIVDFLGGSIPWIKIGDATQGDDIYLHSTKEHIIEAGIKKSRFIKSGSLIFANCGVSLGFARIITFDGCIHDGWLAFQDINQVKLNKVFLLKSLNMCTEHFRRTAPDGTQPNLNTDIMKKYIQILPPLELQEEFAQFIQQVDKLKFEMQQSLAELENNFNALMQKAFNGELF